MRGAVIPPPIYLGTNYGGGNEDNGDLPHRIPLCPLPAPGHHSCTFCLHGFASSNASYEWNHVMRGLLSLNSFMYAFLELISLAPCIRISHL